MACGTLVPQPGTEPGSLAVKVQSLNPWSSREFPIYVSLFVDYLSKAGNKVRTNIREQAKAERDRDEQD